MEPADGSAGDAKAKAPAKPRQNKTPLQKEVLEASYQLNQHPSVEHRKALGDRIGLTEHEVNVRGCMHAWFTNRRRRDKQAEKKAAAASLSAGGSAGTPGGVTPGGAGGTSPSPGGAAAAAAPVAGAPAGLARHVPPPQQLATTAAAAAAASGGAVSCPDAEEETEDADDDASDAAAAAWEGIRALCMAARATLPVPYCEDGPQLGFLFDEPPMPGELSAAGGGNKRRRIVLGNDLVAEADEEGVKSVLLRRPGGGKAGIQGGGPVGVMTVAELEMRRRELHLQQQALEEARQDDPDYKSGGRKSEDAIKREQERLRKELLRQQEKLERDRKREEDERSREMERHERERKKMADKMEKDRAKEEARKLKELEKLKIAEERELKRLEAAREKERKAEERRRAVEERKKEKENARALAQQERAVLRMRHRESANGPPDDEELEYRKLLIAAGIDPATVADADEDAAAAGAAAGEAAASASVTPPPPPRKRPRPDLPRPEFPPPSLGLEPAWPASYDAEGEAAADGGVGDFGTGPDGLDDDIGSELLVCWSFLQSFADLFGVKVPSLEGLLEALAEGEESRLLADVHCALLRLIQADMEDAHDEKERVGRQTAAAPNFMDRSVVGSARRLEEAWAWGYDVDCWRAHLNALTWPEVLRQVAVVAGRGRSRPPIRRSAADGTKGPRIQGIEGEDVVDDGSSGGSLKLRMPSRYVLGTVKAAAWQVLASTGPSGLPVAELVRRIQRTGLREMRSSKTPEAVVAGSLARDVLFMRVQPATWALTSVVAFAKRRNEQRRGSRHAAKGGAKTGEAGDGGADGDGDTEMADVSIKGEAPEPAAGVKQEPGLKQEPSATAAGGGLGSRRRGKAGDAGGSQPMDVDTGTVKQEDVKDEAATGPAPGPGPANGRAASVGGAEDISRAATASPPASTGGANLGAADVAQGGGSQHQQSQGAGASQQPQLQDHDHDDESYSGDEEEEDGEAHGGERGAGDPWVNSLLSSGYSTLGLRDRIAAMSFLCHAVLDGPTLRTKLELRTNEAAQRRKQVFEDAKNDKRKRQEEAAARAAAAAEEARKRAEAAAAAAAAGGSGAAAGTSTGGAGGSRGSTPAPPGAPVDPKAIAGEIFGTVAAAAPLTEGTKADAARRAEEEEDEKQKRQQRADEMRRIDEECAIRAEPLGSDRRYNRYWLFTTGEEGDAGSGRLWVESAPEGTWRLLTTPQQLDELVASLEPKGVREGQLAQALAHHADRIKRSMPGVAPLSEPTPLDALPEETRAALTSAAAARAEVIRLQAYSHVVPDDDYTAELQLPDSDSISMQRFKRDLLRLETAVPVEAMDEGFQRMTWAERVQTAPSPAVLRTCLGQLEAALLPSPDGTSPGLLATVFHRHPPLVRGAWVEVGKEVATALPGHACKEVLPPAERVDGQPQAMPSDEPLAWLPATLPALTLRLLSLDASIIFRAGVPPGRDSQAGYKYTVRPAPLDAQPAVVAVSAAAAAGPPHADAAGGPAPPASAALPMAIGGGAVVLTNVLADRGRVNHAIRRVPELPPEIMTLRAREFTLPVEEMRESVAEADKQGLLNAASAAAGGKGKGKGAGKGGSAAAANGSSKAGAATTGKVGSRSVVVVSGLRGAAASNKNKGGSKTKGLSAPGVGSRAKGGGKSGGGGAAGGSRGKAAATATTEEPEGDEEWMQGTGEQLGEPVLLGPEDEDDLGFSEDNDGLEEGYDDPYDSDYR
ncbi:homeodomain protein [Volvox carteri f. nagariensis]|uniref:Homeodomain protein n=1 Tax=Volvox carteri f. nagariensis TaxID=3068 RepID=D8UJY3_VOLCA|nr:homeodomain protein [Volvox carteri f. nagariensis]EFJ39975.1 homeodomain protein [Volvox carteri f. nagariensis]|eukprot:XP_002958970.1 homeodomain protein [Volvox carteri f. nagariensis]